MVTAKPGNSTPGRYFSLTPRSWMPAKTSSSTVQPMTVLPCAVQLRANAEREVAKAEYGDAGHQILLWASAILAALWRTA